ncbi:hypothetical protein MICRO80W_30019 [Micrococcus luteus]|nr:hypothetical protein MICRO80W_30019 [Micrococcus luteus]
MLPGAVRRPRKGWLPHRGPFALSRCECS